MDENKVVTTLHVEDNPGDARLVREMLSESEPMPFRVEHCDRLRPAIERLERGGIDIILTDLKLPDSAGLPTFAALHAQAPDLPIVIMSGTYEEERLALEALDGGAQDYLPKDHITRHVLVRSLCYAIERKRLEQQLKTAAEAKVKLASMVSHELRIPLAAMRLCLGNIMDETAGSINEQQRHMLTLLKRSVDRLCRLTTNVLDFQKLENGKGTFDMQMGDINNVARDVHRDMLLLVADKKIDFVLELEEPLPRTSFDRDSITQVFANLVSNALKFTETGAITISTRRDQGMIQAAVKDTGIGIRDEDRPKVFGAFEQFATGIQTEKGTGLGLAICKDIIERHDGRIWVESDLGRGTTFSFALPIRD